MHSLVLALTLTLALILTLYHLANEPLQMATMLYGLMYSSTTEHKYSVRCAQIINVT